MSNAENFLILGLVAIGVIVLITLFHSSRAEKAWYEVGIPFDSEQGDETGWRILNAALEQGANPLWSTLERFWHAGKLEAEWPFLTRFFLLYVASKCYKFFAGDIARISNAHKLSNKFLLKGVYQTLLNYNTRSSPDKLLSVTVEMIHDMTDLYTPGFNYFIQGTSPDLNRPDQINLMDSTRFLNTCLVPNLLKRGVFDPHKDAFKEIRNEIHQALTDSLLAMLKAISDILTPSEASLSSASPPSVSPNSSVPPGELKSDKSSVAASNSEVQQKGACPVRTPRVAKRSRTIEELEEKMPNAADMIGQVMLNFAREQECEADINFDEIRSIADYILPGIPSIGFCSVEKRLACFFWVCRQLDLHVETKEIDEREALICLLLLYTESKKFLKAWTMADLRKGRFRARDYVEMPRTAYFALKGINLP